MRFLFTVPAGKRVPAKHLSDEWPSMIDNFEKMAVLAALDRTVVKNELDGLDNIVEMLVDNQQKLPEESRGLILRLNNQIQEIRQVTVNRARLEDLDIQPARTTVIPKSFTEIGNYMRKSTIGGSNSAQATALTGESLKNVVNKNAKIADFHKLSSAELMMIEQEYSKARNRVPPESEIYFPSLEAYKTAVISEVIHTYLIPGIIEKVNCRFYKDLLRKLS